MSWKAQISAGLISGELVSGSDHKIWCPFEATEDLKYRAAWSLVLGLWLDYNEVSLNEQK